MRRSDPEEASPRPRVSASPRLQSLSLRFAILLMALIAAACLVGTLVVQRSDDPHGAISRYYGSWWFIGLLGLLVLSTAVCAFSGLRLTLRRFFMLLVHGSILLIAAGAVVSGIARVDGLLFLGEGEATDAFETERGDVIPLGFTLRLDQFTVRNFESGVSVLDEMGREVRKGVVLVNSPFTFRRYTFYQQSYSRDESNGVYSILLVKSDPGVPLVFAGFMLLPIGIALAIYAKPRKAREDV
jgi:cytochrome c biogenesis protein ResB